MSSENTCKPPDDYVGKINKLLSDSIAGAAKDGAVVEAGGDVKERACDSLVMCIVTTLNQGLRNGGGIGDILRAPSSKVGT